ncbi:MAG: Asp23/Gls24 family envelope stress response protein [bacterium]|nr:Asp23/Gls24 family envelope stress response protein [bacterium]
MADTVETSLEVKGADNGKIIFADDVVATIAALAAADVQGVASMSGGVVEGLTEMLGKKNLTKGVKVEVGTEEAAVDISVNVRYGFAIQEVCQNLQNAIKNAIETMTGLRVVEVNVYVQSVVFEKPAEPEPEKKEKKEKPVKEEKEPEPPRVK